MGEGSRRRWNARPGQWGGLSLGGLCLRLGRNPDGSSEEGLFLSLVGLNDLNCCGWIICVCVDTVSGFYRFADGPVSHAAWVPAGLDCASSAPLLSWLSMTQQLPFPRPASSCTLPHGASPAPWKSPLPSPTPGASDVIGLRGRHQWL